MKIDLDNDQERTLRITLQQPLISSDSLIRYIDLQLDSGIHSEDKMEVYQELKKLIIRQIDHSELLRIMLFKEE